MARTRLRRTELVLPADDARKAAKAATLPADEVIFDLEDAIPEARKVAARADAVRLLRATDLGARVRALRINDLRSPWWRDELALVAGAVADRLDVVVVPKVESADDVRAVAAALDRIDAAGRVGIEAQLETARGVAHAEEIAESSPRLESLVFGAGDYAASMGIPVLRIAEEAAAAAWQYALARIANAAHAAGLDAIDGPYGAIDDDAGLARASRAAALLGYQGKWAVHPRQLGPIAAAFTPSPADVASARRIVARYREASEEGHGALAVDGDLVDAVSLRLAEGVLRRARLAGDRGI